MVDNPSAFFDVGDLPDGAIIKEPSRMNKLPMQELLTHWVEKQKKGEQPFRFHHTMDSKGVFVAAIYPGDSKKKKRRAKKTKKDKDDDGTDGDDESEGPRSPLPKARKRKLKDQDKDDMEGDDESENPRSPVPKAEKKGPTKRKGKVVKKEEAGTDDEIDDHLLKEVPGMIIQKIKPGKDVVGGALQAKVQTKGTGRSVRAKVETKSTGVAHNASSASGWSDVEEEVIEAATNAIPSQLAETVDPATWAAITRHFTQKDVIKQQAVVVPQGRPNQPKSHPNEARWMETRGTKRKAEAQDGTADAEDTKQKGKRKVAPDDKEHKVPEKKSRTGRGSKVVADVPITLERTDKTAAITVTATKSRARAVVKAERVGPRPKPRPTAAKDKAKGTKS